MKMVCRHSSTSLSCLRILRLCLQASDKGTKLIDEDGLFSLVAAAPDAKAAAVAPKPGAKTEAIAAVHAIPAGNFYAGKTSAANEAQAKKAALSAGSLAASGQLIILPSTPHCCAKAVCSTCIVGTTIRYMGAKHD